MTIEGSHGGWLVPCAVLVSATCSVFLDPSPRMCYKYFIVQNWRCKYIHVGNLIIWVYSKIIYWAIDNSVFETCKQTLQCLSRPNSLHNLCLSSSIRPTALLKKSKNISRKEIIANAFTVFKSLQYRENFFLALLVHFLWKKCRGKKMFSFSFQPILEGNSLVQLF